LSEFNPVDHLVQLRGKRGGAAKPYLPVSARIQWFRQDHPEGRIETEAYSVSENSAIFIARVWTAEGGSAFGYGSEELGDFADFIEKAETKAIGRALSHMGYGTMSAIDDDGVLADSPVEVAMLSSVQKNTILGMGVRLGYESPERVNDRIQELYSCDLDQMSSNQAGALINMLAKQVRELNPGPV
jgi:hypothetical protein